MECEYEEYGKNRSFSKWDRNKDVREQKGDGDVGGERLGPPYAPPPPGIGRATLDRATDPFVNDMDEVAFWVYTKQAPCLMNFDNVIKKQYEAVQNPKLSKSVKSVPEVVPCPKKKKRKLSLLDDEGGSEKRLNVYFVNSMIRKHNVASSCKSDTIESDIDFNIKNSSIQNKSKTSKAKRDGKTLHNKKNTVVTSTPVRRSLRRNNNGISKTVQCSFEQYQSDNLKQSFALESSPETKSGLNIKKSLSKAAAGDAEKKKSTSGEANHKIVLNGHYDDMSDVSGFTANYIRSTKLHSATKPNKNLRNKCSKTLVRESQQSFYNEDTKMLVCVNKAVNATSELPQTSVLNCSTDSSQNVLNLITVKNTRRQSKVNKSTSLLKFVDIKPKSKENNSLEKLNISSDTQKGAGDISFQSKNTSVSRYPKRTRNCRVKNITVSSSQSKMMTRSALDKRKKSLRNATDLNSPERKENPEESKIIRTRNRNSATTLHYQQNDVMVYSIPTEDTSTVRLNVASQPSETLKKPRLKRMSSGRCGKILDRHSSNNLRDSVREKSGYAACFSDSDDDNEALRQRKFFC